LHNPKAYMCYQRYPSISKAEALAFGKTLPLVLDDYKRSILREWFAVHVESLSKEIDHLRKIPGLHQVQVLHLNKIYEEPAVELAGSVSQSNRPKLLEPQAEGKHRVL
jgi:hypothetical protein